MAQYECKVCGYFYDEAEGCAEQGIAPGTKWADVPDSFECPLCGAGKEDFELKSQHQTRIMIKMTMFFQAVPSGMDMVIFSWVYLSWFHENMIFIKAELESLS